MVTPTIWLPQLYQRFQAFWDRAVPSAGLALLLWASAEATRAYPSEWRVFLAALLFVIGLRWPAFAYVAFTFFISFPLYRISIYLAAIVLAVLVLSSHWAMRNLGATVLVLATPALLPFHLEAGVPLLAGLWWGEWAGALAGGLAALWLKLLAGMAGLRGAQLDLVQLSGWTPTGGNIIHRFGAFNSLQTLFELVNPFADTSETLLLHVLQVFVWAVAGYATGWLARRAWTDRQRAWAPLLSVLPAVFILEASYTLLPGLLNRLEKVIINTPGELTAWLFVSGLAAAGVRMFFLYLQRPLVQPARRRIRRAGSLRQTTNTPGEQSGRQPETDAAQPTFDWKPPNRARPTSDKDEDVIMLEID